MLFNKKLKTEMKRIDDFFKQEIEGLFGQQVNLEAVQKDMTHRTVSNEERIFGTEVRIDHLISEVRKFREEIDILKNLIQGIKWDADTTRSVLSVITRVGNQHERRVSSKRRNLVKPAEVQNSGTLPSVTHKQKTTNISYASRNPRPLKGTRRKKV